MTKPFADPDTLTKAQREDGAVFAPKFDAAGLVTAVAVDDTTREVLMVAHMNAEAIARTLSTGFAHYYSRSRGRLWMKGETSGERQRVIALHTDCDQDAIVMAVRQEGHGAACHTGRRSCFYRKLVVGPDGRAGLEDTGEAPLFDPERVYKG